MSTRTDLRNDLRVRLAALVAIVLLGNYLLFDVVLRIDLTGERVYSLSPASRAVVGHLEHPLTVKAYFTGNLPFPYGTYEEAVRGKLDQYKAYASSRFTVIFSDPSDKPELEAEARRFGIAEAKINDRARGEVKTAYMGLAFVYGDKQEVIPIVESLSGLEYEISRAIKKLTRPGRKKTIGFVRGHGEPDLLEATLAGGGNPLREALEANYTLIPVDLSASPQIPDEVDALVVFSPSKPFPKRHQFEVDQFLMAGKPVGFFIASHLVDTRLARLDPLDHGLAPLLESYGVKLTGSLVFDRQQNGRTQVPVRQGDRTILASVNYPLHPLATTFDKTSIIVRDEEAMILPLHQALELTDAAKDRADMRVHALISSSKFSAIKKKGRMPPLDPQQLAAPGLPEEELSGPFPMAFTLEGTFRSYWDTRSLPNDDGSLDGRTVVRNSPPNRILVVGGAEFVRHSMAVFLNMIDWLAQDEDLISIRSRDTRPATLEPVSEGAQRLFCIVNVVGVPLLFILFGVVRRFLRRRAREKAARVREGAQKHGGRLQ